MFDGGVIISQDGEGTKNRKSSQQIQSIDMLVVEYG